jgi:hypothetical protein
MYFILNKLTQDVQMVFIKVQVVIVNKWFLMRESYLDVQMAFIVAPMEIVRESRVMMAAIMKTI